MPSTGDYWTTSSMCSMVLPDLTAVSCEERDWRVARHDIIPAFSGSKISSRSCRTCESSCVRQERRPRKEGRTGVFFSRNFKGTDGDVGHVQWLTRIWRGQSRHQNRQTNNTPHATAHSTCLMHDALHAPSFRLRTHTSDESYICRSCSDSTI